MGRELIRPAREGTAQGKRTGRIGLPAVGGALVVVLLVAFALFMAGRTKGADWRVLNLYSGETSLDLLRRPAQVRVFRVDPVPGRPEPDAVHAGPFVAAGPARDLAPDAAASLSSILADAATYDWLHAKRAPFRPQLGVWFVRGAYTLEVVLDLESAQIAVYAGGQTLGAEDFDAARTRLVAIAKSAFPDDPAIAALK